MVTKVSIVEDVLKMVAEEMEQGEGLGDACQTVIGRVIADKRGNELLLARGARIIRDIYREENRHVRAETFAEASPEQGDRKANPDVLNRAAKSFYAMSFYVEGKGMVALGDMKKTDLVYVQGHYKKQAETMGKRSQFLGTIAEGLSPRASVRSKYTEDDLRAMYDAIVGELSD